jgi:hypothetical protein
MVCSVWPPQMPYCWPVRTANVRQSSRTGQVAQMATAAWMLSSLSAKNGSSSAVTRSRQAARSCQEPTSVISPHRPAGA